MGYSAGAAGTLFHANYKINTPEKGFNMKFHIQGADYATVMPKAVSLSEYIRNVMPADASIFYATVTNDDNRRDSRFLRGALGPGLVAAVVGPPAVPSVYDMPQTAMLVRLENTEGDAVTRKINPIPDSVISDALAGGAITDVTGTPGSVAAAGSGGDWYANFNLLMKAICYYTVFVKSGHAPGGAFQYAPWLNAYYLRPGIKKGGRVFSS
ncbi:MAG: hypothetical protein JOZ10_16185 [Acidobacteria bacterium]|nr:hypothetical protein [Acidobacteriota bacterium]